MKKLLSFFLSIALLSTLSFTAYATEVAPSVPQEHAICLSQTGKVNDVKLSFKYGHNQFGPAVSVSYPWGVSFGLDGAETIFQPDEIVYNDFATVK